MNILSGPQLKAVRKALTSMLSAQAAAKQRPIQEAESTQLMYEMLQKPKVRTFVSDIKNMD